MKLSQNLSSLLLMASEEESKSHLQTLDYSKEMGGVTEKSQLSNINIRHFYQKTGDGKLLHRNQPSSMAWRKPIKILEPGLPKHFQESALLRITQEQNGSEVLYLEKAKKKKKYTPITPKRHKTLPTHPPLQNFARESSQRIIR